MEYGPPALASVDAFPEVEFSAAQEADKTLQGGYVGVGQKSRQVEQARELVRLGEIVADQRERIEDDLTNEEYESVWFALRHHPCWRHSSC